MAKNILVTGGAGFVGSHFIDNFSTGTVKNIDSLMQHPNFEFLKRSVNDPLDIEDLTELEKFKVKFNGVQEVYHLASPTSAKNFNQYREETLATNSIGVLNA